MSGASVGGGVAPARARASRSPFRAHDSLLRANGDSPPEFSRRGGRLWLHPYAALTGCQTVQASSADKTKPEWLRANPSAWSRFRSRKPPDASRKNSAMLYLESLIKPNPAKVFAPVAAAPAASLTAAKSAWARIEIEDGLELHVRDDYQLADEARERQRLARAILNELDKQRK